ncbi:MAG: MBOAT family protein [Clostridium sp.]|nr:MBOAT family protein [Clostridium sp.]
MQIVSIEFLIFFAGILIIYHMMPGAFRCTLLLLASYFFYGSQDPWYLIFLAAATIVSYGGALLMEHFRGNPFYKKILMCFSIGLNLLMLGYFKYAGFLTGGRIKSLLLPVGISFYLFMSCSYLADVYLGKISAEKNLLQYALFVSFFPTILSGPIERASHMLPQFSKECFSQVKFDTERIRDGFVRMLWGFFLKLVLADRISILVNTVYLSPEKYGGAIIGAASILYTFQIYCDFAGYSHIAIGMAKALGIGVMENFRQPYLAVSIPDFWRRWHISLSTWFRDYVYIPLGGNRKGTFRKYINLMVVFLLSGLWHGAGWTFVLWGGIHGAYQIAGALLSPVMKKISTFLKMKEQSGSLKIIKIMFTFCLVSFAWIFFQAESLASALQIIRRFLNPRIWELFDGTFHTLGLDAANIAVMFIGLFLLAAVDLLNERGIFLSRLIAKERLWIRWPVYITAVLFILICGVWGSAYDTASFIYYQF